MIAIVSRSLLTPGDRYRVEVTATGFSPGVQENVPVRLASENTADISVALAGSTEEVNVSGADQQLIQSTQSQLSQQFTPRQLTELPFNGGGIDNLALLVPGVSTTGDASFSNGVGISANGNRGRSNNFQIDGQDNNDNSIAGPSLTLTNTEAVGEYQVITNTFSAEFGRNSGAQINTITKSGTNNFHGAIFEFLQNSALNTLNNTQKRAAATFRFLGNNGFPTFSQLATNRQGKDPFTLNRFGGAIGGPLPLPRFGEGGRAYISGKNRSFFFITYQGDRQRGEQIANNLGTGGITFTPQSAALAASLGFPGGQILTNPGIGGGPAFVQGVGQLIVLPPVFDATGTGIPNAFVNPGGAFTNSVFVRNAAGQIVPLQTGEGVRIFRNDFSEDQLITREDFNLTSKDLITARYIYDTSKFPIAVGRAVAGALFDVPSQNNNLGVTETHTISSRFVNEVRFNFSRLNVLFGDPSGVRPGPGIQFSGVRDLAGNFSSLTFGTQNNLPQSRKVDVYQEQDTVSATLSNHAVKFGADIRQQKVNNFFLPNFLGTFTFRGGSGAGSVTGQNFFTAAGAPRTGNATGFENLLLGRPQRINFALGNPVINTQQNDYFFFVQDDYRVRPNLTLNLGLRYELSTTPFNPIIEALNTREADPNRSIFGTSFPLSTRTATKLRLDKNNFAPRVGFAYQPNFNILGGRFTNGRTVIRGGFGIAYDPSFFNIVLNTVTAAPFAGDGQVVQLPGAPGSLPFPSLPNTTAQLATTPGTNGGDPRLFNQTRVSPNFYNPYTMSYNFGIQQEIFKNSVLEVRYVGSRIVGQFQSINANPDLRFYARAGQALFNDPGRFTGGLVSPGATADNNFSSRPGTNGNGRVNPTFGLVRQRTNGATSTYNGLQVRFDTRLRNTLTLNANYSFSRTIDNASEIFGTFGGGQTVAFAQNPFDVSRGERGLSAFHQKHIFTSNLIYDVPFFKEQKGVLGKTLGGFQVSTLIRLGSGRPYTPQNILATGDPNFENGFAGSGVLRPFNGNPSAPIGTLAVGNQAAQNLIGGVTTDSPTGFYIYNTLKPGSQPVPGTLRDARLVYNDFGLISQFGFPITGDGAPEAFSLFRTPFGDVGRNTFLGLPNYNANVALFKTMKFSESKKIEFRVEATNLLNHRNFGVPDPFTEDAYAGSAVGPFQNPGFNTGENRQLRFGLRFVF